MRSITILGVRVDNVTLDQAAEQIAQFIAARTPHQIVTVNPEFVMEAQHNAAFAQVLERASLAVPDGIGLILVARWLGQPLQGRVPGVELTERLAALSAHRGYRLFLLGAAPGVAETTAHVLEQRFPGVMIVGCYAGSPRPEDEAAIHVRILAAKPDILLVAYGAPAQDLWIARNQSLLQIPVAIGVGGTFDYLSGKVQRAPRWLQLMGLEWLFRLLRQPWRWKRIWTAVVCFPLKVWWHQRRQSVRSLD